jgi:adenylate cyclase
MAFWNAPLDDPDHAVHAVRAGLDMLAALDKLNTEFVEEARAGTLPLRLGIGIGINTGDCRLTEAGFRSPINSPRKHLPRSCP